MSKLFPMFKKKGKGKDDAVEDDQRKKRRGGKQNKHKDDSSSPSVSPSKHAKKKGKESKQPRPLSYGKENILEADLEELHPHEFYVDDDGTVKLGSTQDGTSFNVTYEDEVIVGQRGQNSEVESMDITIEHEFDVHIDDEDRKGDVVGGFCEDVFEASTEFFKESMGSNENIVDESLPAKTVTELVEAKNETYHEDAPPEHHPYPVDGRSPCIFVDSEHDDDVTEDGNAGDRSPRELDTIIDNEEETQMVDEQKQSKKTNNEDDNKTKPGDVANTQPECEKGGSEESLRYHELSSSQDSDEDFDSAQEDWDEGESVPKAGLERKGSGADSGLAEEGHMGQEVEFTENVVEKNQQNIKCNNFGEGLISDKSFTEDVMEACNVDCVEAYNGGLAGVEAFNTSMVGLERKNSAGKDRLVRKLSGMSNASSDAFNEELDEFLDEELDRLSEEDDEPDSEESKSMHTCHSTASAAVDNSLEESLVEALVEGDDKIDSTGAVEELDVEDQNTQHPIDSPDADVVKEENTLDIPNTSELIITDENNAITDTDDIDNLPIPKDSLSSSIASEDCCSLKSAASSPDVVKKTLLHPDDSPEVIKDSGYYSLPVSPKPGGEARDTMAALQEVDDALEDSEEEGAKTPTADTTVIKPVVEKQKHDPSGDVVNVTQETSDVESTAAVVDHDKVDASKEEPVAEDSEEGRSNGEASDNNPENESLLYQTCLESDETENLDNVEKIPEPSVEENKEVIVEETKEQEKHIPVKEASDAKGDSDSVASPVASKSRASVGENSKPEGLRSPDPVGDKFLTVAVCGAHNEAEARLAQRRAARAEARELRLRELEKQQQEQDNDEEKQFGTPQAFAEPAPRALGTTRAGLARAGLAGQFSRRSSEDSTTDDSALPANVKEMRAELKELDDKFRKAMITNASLDNEKATLTFEVELLKDKYTELEETHTQLSKEHRKKCTDFEQLKKVATKLQEEVKALRTLLQERDGLIQEYGLVVVGEENGEEAPGKDEEDEFADMDDLTPRKIAVKKALLSQEAAELVSKGAAKDSLDVRLRKFGEEKKELEDQVRRLKLELEEEKNKNRRRKENGLDYQKEQNKTVNEYKFRVQKAEAEVNTLQANVARLDALTARYRVQTDELEKSEEELKSEKRKLQRELRDTQSRLEELESTNSHLIKRFDKLKNARSTLLKDLSQDPV